MNTNFFFLKIDILSFKWHFESNPTCPQVKMHSRNAHLCTSVWEVDSYPGIRAVEDEGPWWAVSVLSESLMLQWRRDAVVYFCSITGQRSLCQPASLAAKPLSTSYPQGPSYILPQDPVTVSIPAQRTPQGKIVYLLSSLFTGLWTPLRTEAVSRSSPNPQKLA